MLTCHAFLKQKTQTAPIATGYGWLTLCSHHTNPSLARNRNLTHEISSAIDRSHTKKSKEGGPSLAIAWPRSTIFWQKMLCSWMVFCLHFFFQEKILFTLLLSGENSVYTSAQPTKMVKNENINLYRLQKTEMLKHHNFKEIKMCKNYVYTSAQPTKQIKNENINLYRLQKTEMLKHHSFKKIKMCKKDNCNGCR